MPVKVAFATQEAVPEPLREKATLVEGKYIVEMDGDASGMVPAADLVTAKKSVDDFRKTNIERGKELDALKGRFEGVDIEEYKKLKKAADDVAAAAGKGGNSDEWDAKLAKTIEPLQKTITTLTEKVEASDAAKVKAEELVTEQKVEGKIREMGVTVGIADTALQDYIGRGKGVWRMGENGTPVAMDGDTPMLSEATGQNLTMEEWAVGLRTTAPHLFKPSKGGGAAPGAGAAGPKKVISSLDPIAIGENIDAIKKGEVIVRRPQ